MLQHVNMEQLWIYHVAVTKLSLLERLLDVVVGLNTVLFQFLRSIVPVIIPCIAYSVMV